MASLLGDKGVRDYFLAKFSLPHRGEAIIIYRSFSYSGSIVEEPTP